MGLNGSANSEDATAKKSIMLDLDLNKMANEQASFGNENSQNDHSKTELELHLKENTLPLVSQFDILSW